MSMRKRFAILLLATSSAFAQTSSTPRSTVHRAARPAASGPSKVTGDPTKTDPKVWEEFKKLTPIGKFPALKDDARNWFVPESTTIR